MGRNAMASSFEHYEIAEKASRRLSMIDLPLKRAYPSLLSVAQKDPEINTSLPKLKTTPPYWYTIIC